MSVPCEGCVLSGRGLCDGLITRPEESYRLWWVVACDLKTSWMRRPWPTGDSWAQKGCQISLCSLKKVELLSIPSHINAISHSVRNYNIKVAEFVIIIIFSSTFVKMCQLIQQCKRSIHKRHRHLEGLLPSLVSHFLCCLTTGSNTSKRGLQRVRSSDFSVKSHDLLFFLRSSSRCLRLLSLFSRPFSFLQYLVLEDSSYEKYDKSSQCSFVLFYADCFFLHGHYSLCCRRKFRLIINN